MNVMDSKSEKKAKENTKDMKKEKGITLVALVITIVILVILVGVTISVAINSRLLTNAKKVVDEYNKMQNEENRTIQNIVEEIEKWKK